MRTEKRTAPWPKVPIKAVYSGFFDGVHGTPKVAAEGPVFLGIKNITEDGHLDLSDVRHIAEEDFPKWTRRVEPHPGDIVFTYEATLNHYAIIPEGFRGCLGRRLGLIRPDPQKVDTRFLFYYFFGDEWRRTIATNTIPGATVERIPIISFPDFQITLPPLPTQHRIAAILSAYDDLVENNNRRIKILEEIARLIYHEWFVEFRFPGRNRIEAANRTASTVPSGWRLSTLADVADINALTLNRDDRPDEIEYVDIASVSTGRIDKVQRLQFKDAPGRARRRVRHGDIIWSSVRPNRKSYSLVLYPGSNLVVSTGFTVITPRAVLFSYLYPATTTDGFVGYLTNHARGAAYPAVTSADFETAQILLPDEAVLKAYDEAVAPLYLEAALLTAKNTLLRRTRDLLLPRLISSEQHVTLSGPQLSAGEAK